MNARNRLINRDAFGNAQILAAGRRRLERRVTNVDGSVYCFVLGEAVTYGLAMARVSRSPSDFRAILLEEFSDDGQRRDDLANNVIGTYGDDSVMQLIPVMFVIEGASNWMTKQIEWSRLMAYLEQSTRYIYFDQKDAEGHWKYYVPPNIHGGLRRHYRRSIDAIFGHYSEIVQQVTSHVREVNPQGDTPRAAWISATKAQACDAARVLLPTAARSTVAVVGNTQTLQNFVIHLNSLEMEEAHVLAQRLLVEARKLDGLAPILQRADAAHRGGATSDYKRARRLAMEGWVEYFDAQSSTYPPASGVEVNLIDYWPQDEHELVGRLLFAQSDLPLSELIRRAGRMTPEDRASVIRDYCCNRYNRRARPGRAIERALFEWEIVGDYGTFRDLQRHRMVDAFEWQKLSIQHGYTVPNLLEEAGCKVKAERCFEYSAELFGELQKAGFDEEAQYATLLAHRMRYSFTANLRELFHLIELRTQPAGHPGYRNICQQMFARLQEVYPAFTAEMTFLNVEEDAALTRLDADMTAESRRRGETQRSARA